MLSDRDLVILLLHANDNEPITSKEHLEWMMFLVRKLIPK